MIGPPSVAPNWFRWKGLAFRALGLVPDERVEVGISYVLPCVAMELVGAGLGGGIEHSGMAAADLRAVVAGLELELGDGIRRGRQVVRRAIDVVAV